MQVKEAELLHEVRSAIAELAEVSADSAALLREVFNDGRAVIGGLDWIDYGALGDFAGAVEAADYGALRDFAGAAEVPDYEALRSFNSLH